MTRGVPEKDWRVFRDVREGALERLCARVLGEAEAICRDGSRDHHERYLELFRLLRERDEELGRAFDDPRRSRMLWQLSWMQRLGVLDADDLERFSAETREALEMLREDGAR